MENLSDSKTKDTGNKRKKVESVKDTKNRGNEKRQSKKENLKTVSGIFFFIEF